MKTKVLSVAMVMMCGMVVQAVKPQKDFNLQKFAGKWYRVGLAYDSPGFERMRDKVKISMGIVSVMPSGNVNLTMWEALTGFCMLKFYQYNKTNVPGRFTYYSTRHSIVKDITVVDTNYTEYAVVLKYKNFNREYTQVALYARSPRTSIEVMQKFKAFALSRGFPRTSILSPPPAENCPAS
ncbi:prostaglandin D2 synthase a [Cyprinodon tularosa]|uniref:prostaglandin D2 synthase a n=1 Tax=Cyprinodon tularosa TaxID=77115 RepID=UPI0018E206C9|nr:prostaglandin D2 synthase a [Cyprinodon tularosa]